MAELPKQRTMSLIPGIGPGSAPVPALTLDLPELQATPEESLQKFRDIASHTKKVGRLPIDASRVAQALQKVTVPSSASGRVSRVRAGRSIAVPAEIYDAIEGILGSARAIPGFVRDAILQVARERVPPKKLVDQANEIARARRAGQGKVSLTVNMDLELRGTIEVLAQRTKLSDKAVMEACTVLYLQAVVASQES